jgi:nucleoside-diphosphate-sugar epimerase
VLSRFSTAFLDSTPPVVFGDGEQTRDFTYVDNAALANILACEAPSASGRTFNIGTGHAVSLNQVLQMLQKASGKTLETKYEPAREGDIRDSLADIRLAKEFLGYEPLVQFAEGLERTFAWYQANHAKNVAS